MSILPNVFHSKDLPKTIKTGKVVKVHKLEEGFYKADVFTTIVIRNKKYYVVEFQITDSHINVIGVSDTPDLLVNAGVVIELETELVSDVDEMTFIKYI